MNERSPAGEPGPDRRIRGQDTSRPDNDPRLSNESSKAGRLQRALLERLQMHEADGAIPTNGQFLWYELEQLGVVDKNKRRGKPGVVRGEDQDLNEALTYLREHEIIPWGWIVDETRDLYMYDGSITVLDGMRRHVDFVELDPWGEPPPVLLCESRSLRGVLDRLASEYRCRIAATNGQTAGFLHTRVGPSLRDGQRILYLGDFDLAANQIEDNTRGVLSQYAYLRWKRLALTEDQLDAHDLRRLAIEKRDRRYRDGRPHLAVETEALSQALLLQIVRDRLDALLPQPLAAVLEREREQREQVAELLS